LTLPAFSVPVLQKQGGLIARLPKDQLFDLEQVAAGQLMMILMEAKMIFAQLALLVEFQKQAWEGESVS